MKTVHLPFYDDNPYQSLLMNAQQEMGWEAIEGGGGGNFLRSALYRWRAQVIHFHWLHPYMIRNTKFGTCLRGSQLILELMILCITGKTLIWTMHNVHSHDSKQPGLELFFRRLAVRFFDKVLCHSQASAAVARNLIGVSPDKIIVTPHPNFIEFYPNQISRSAAREKLGFVEDETVFLFLGRLARYKGVETLINDFAEIKNKNARLVIAGSPSSPDYGRKLQELAGRDPRIHFEARRILDEEVQVYMNAADVVVLPFKKILTSGSAVLAMGFGKPIIAPMEGGLTEILAESPLLFDSEGPVTSLRWALKHSSQLASAGASNQRQARKWSWNQLAKVALG